MRRLLSLILCILIVFVCFAAYGGSPTGSLPKPHRNIYINDFAKVIDSETEAVIEEASAAVEKKSTAQIAVVTVSTTAAKPIEDYSLRLLRQWGIGGKASNNGVLLLVSVQDRRARIEVGYGLEDVLNDAKCGRILDDMLPYFKANDYNKGIMIGYDTLVSIVGKKYGIDIKRSDDWMQWYLQQPITAQIAIAAVFLIILCIIFGTKTGRTLVIFALRSSNGGPKGRFGGWGKGGGGGGGGASRRW